MRGMASVDGQCTRRSDCRRQRLASRSGHLPTTIVPVEPTADRPLEQAIPILLSNRTCNEVEDRALVRIAEESEWLVPAAGLPSARPGTIAGGTVA